ncbi:SDR family NAD(P)-dependent oxidoreductase [Nonomuraea longicatena]|uniref:SDR family oxidoreductase n=1 Tax=Nonomuraea longicatena TaxID=83682 RepID=A0ABN1Q8F1_9ACTN
MINLGVQERVALLTGGNQGIGAATAFALAVQGVKVFITYKRLEPLAHAAYPDAYDRDRADTAEGVVARIRQAGGVASAAEADLADPETPGRLFDLAEQALGPVEILVNNASGWLADTFAPREADDLGRPLRQVDAASHDHQFAVDTRAPALLIAEFARRHLKRGSTWGRIVGLTSEGRNGFPGEVSYGAAKSAQESYTISAARELGKYGITANMVHPPVTDTGWIKKEDEPMLRGLSPLDHIARPEDVADVVAFLVSEQARCVTAQVIKMS